MSAEEDGRSDDSRERRGGNGRQGGPARRGGDGRGAPGGPAARKGGGPRTGGPRGGGGRPGAGGGRSRDERKPGRPRFERSDDRRAPSREGRSDDRRQGGFGGPRGERPERGERRSEDRRGDRGRPGERRDARFGGSGGPRDERGREERREGRPGGRPGGGPGERRFERDQRGGRFERSGERRFKDRDDRSGRDAGPGGRRFEAREDRDRRDGRPERDGRPGGRRFAAHDERRGRDTRPGGRRFKDDHPGGRRFEGRREDRPGDRDRPGKGRGGPRRPQDGGGRSYGSPRDRKARQDRFEERPRPAPKHDDPLLPEEVTGEELDAEVRAELRSLPKDLAGKVARHLVMAGRLAEDDPDLSYRHAKAARRLASRVGIVREAAGIAAYQSGEWSEALAELRAARRLGAGDDSYLPVMADCERGLGRPERALDLIKSPEADRLDQMGRVELRIVESGVRRDLGQRDAAVVALQIPELRDRRLRPWSVRLFYAYADALAEAGREGEASDWFARAAAADRDGETDAAERYAELEGLHILDTEEEDGTGLEEPAPRDADPGGAAPDEHDGHASEEAEEAGDDPADGDAAADDTAGEAAATDIRFRAAEDHAPDAPETDAPEAPAVFLEPKPVEPEQAGEQAADAESDGEERPGT